jgi:hypothetical protein
LPTAQDRYFLRMVSWVESRRIVLLAITGVGILHQGSRSALAQTRADTGRAAGTAAVAQIGDSTLRTSAHAKLVCVACHTSLDPKNLPVVMTIDPVNCLRCHADAQFKHDFHPELAQAIRANLEPRVTCKECHGTHAVARVGIPGSKFSAGRLVESCGKCHQKAAENFRGSAHGTALAADAAGAPTCLRCHRARITAGRGTVDSLSLKTAQAGLCLTCHLDTPEVRARTSPDAGFIARWDSSKHGSALNHGTARAASCVGCHGSHEIRKAADPTSRVNRANVSTTCAACHANEKKEFSVSVHGLAKNHAQTDSLVCSTCHGEHADPFATGARPVAVGDSAPAQVCERCHAPAVLAGTYGLASDRFRKFTDSYHGLTLRGGRFQAANCVSCHTAHDVKTAKDSTSSVNKANRAATCGKCHQQAIERFAMGPVHDTTVAAAPPAEPSTVDWRIPAGVILAALFGGGLLAYRLARRRTAATLPPA